MEDSESFPAPAAGLHIAVVCGWVHGAYVRTLLSATLAALRRHGAQTSCFAFGAESNGAEPPTSAYLELVRHSGVHGVILLAAASFSTEASIIAQQLHGTPVVAIGQAVAGVPSVWVKNAAGIRAMVAHLVDACGRNRIAFISGPVANAEANARTFAFEDARVEFSLPRSANLVFAGNWTLESGRQAALEFLRAPEKSRPNAIFAANDLMAIGALKAARELGIDVPRQLAVAGFDDLEAMDAHPPLTTIRQPVAELGRQAAKLAVAAAKGLPVADRVILEPELIVRASCGGARKLSGAAPRARQAAFTSPTDRIGAVDESFELLREMIANLELDDAESKMRLSDTSETLARAIYSQESRLELAEARLQRARSNVDSLVEAGNADAFLTATAVYGLNWLQVVVFEGAQRVVRFAAYEGRRRRESEGPLADGCLVRDFLSPESPECLVLPLGQERLLGYCVLGADVVDVAVYVHLVQLLPHIL